MVLITPAQMRVATRIWQQSMDRWANGEEQIILVPFHYQAALSSAGLDLLIKEFSAIIAAPARVVVDSPARVVRITPPKISSIFSRLGAAAGLPSTDQSDRLPGMDLIATSSINTINDEMKGPMKEPAISKTRRPANQFVLYRKDRHAQVVSENPGIHNNDVSKIIGAMWSVELPAVKAQYKALADELKAQHAIDNPGYQYNPRKPGEKKRRKRRADAAKLTLSPEELAEISDLKLIASIEPCPEVESFDYPTFLDGAGLHFQLRHPAGSLHSERIQTMSAANAPRASKRNTMNVEDNQLMHTVMAKLENGLSAVTPVDNDDSPLAHEPLTETASPLSINTSPDRFDAYEDLSPELNKIFGELCGDESGFNFADIIGSHEWPEDLLEFPLP